MSETPLPSSKPNEKLSVLVGIGITAAALGLDIENSYLLSVLIMLGLILVVVPIWRLLEAILEEVRHTNRVEQSPKTNRDE